LLTRLEMGSEELVEGLMQVRSAMAARLGPVVSLAFSSTVDIPARFKNSKAVGAALRLTPILNQSGESNRVGRISLCGDAMMRTLLYEAAQVMLTRVTKWSWLKAWAMNIARRRCLWLLDRRPRLSST
jgi:transposase